ncbi:hypothetical protein HID58_002315, partial [Brassica napus]
MVDVLITNLGFFSCLHKVVWAVDGVVAMDMDVDVDSSKTNSNSKDSKSEKEKGKRNLYVGSQALNYRKDHMDILEIGKRRMIVADPKVFTSGFSLDSRLELSWEWQKNESRRFSRHESLLFT